MRDHIDPLPALKPLARLLAKRMITASEFDAAVAYIGMHTDRRVAVEARLSRAEGEIVRNLLSLHPTDAVRRTARCRRVDIVPRLRKALGQLGKTIG
jgi:hypothetical protein